MSDECFGCGLDNPDGLHLKIEQAADKSAVCTATVPRAYAGEPGVVHGGIQATLLDEVLCKAAQYDMWARDIDAVIVTASMELRYRAACPIDEALTIRAFVDRVEWPSYHVVGSIADQSGNVVTEATARWRVLGDVSLPAGTQPQLDTSIVAALRKPLDLEHHPAGHHESDPFDGEASKRETALPVRGVVAAASGQ